MALAFSAVWPANSPDLNPIDNRISGETGATGFVTWIS